MINNSSSSASFSMAELYDIINAKLSSGGTFVFFPKGTSMNPLIIQNVTSVTLVAPDRIPNKHDILLYRRNNGSFVLHRVMKVCDNGLLSMCGDNQTQIEHGVSHDSVIGVVSEITNTKTGKVISTSSGFAYMAYRFFWCFMPLRRVLLFFKLICLKIKHLFKRK